MKEKLEKLGNIPQVVVFVCLPPPTRTRTQEYICKILGQDVRVSNTPFSKTKLGSIPSRSYHCIFFLPYLFF